MGMNLIEGGEEWEGNLEYDEKRRNCVTLDIDSHNINQVTENFRTLETVQNALL